MRNSPAKRLAKIAKEHDYQLFCLFRTNRYSVYSINSAIGSRIDGILFRSFQNQNRSQKNTITVNSVYSHSGIVPKGRDISDTSAHRYKKLKPAVVFRKFSNSYLNKNHCLLTNCYTIRDKIVGCEIQLSHSGRWLN